MPHGTIRAATLRTIVPMIMAWENCGENEAMKRFYQSHTGACYADDTTGLYGQSALYVFSLYQTERMESISLTRPLPLNRRELSVHPPYQASTKGPT